MNYDSRVWDWASGACLNHKGQELPCQVCIKTRDVDLFRPDIIEAAKAAFNDGVGYVISEATLAEMEILTAWQNGPAECRLHRPGTTYIKPPPDEEIMEGTNGLPLIVRAKVAWMLGEDPDIFFSQLTEEDKTTYSKWVDAHIIGDQYFGFQDPNPDKDRVDLWMYESPVQQAKAAYITGGVEPVLTKEQKEEVDLWIRRRVQKLTTPSQQSLVSEFTVEQLRFLLDKVVPDFKQLVLKELRLRKALRFGELYGGK